MDSSLSQQLKKWREMIVTILCQCTRFATETQSKASKPDEVAKLPSYSTHELT